MKMTSTFSFTLALLFVVLFYSTNAYFSDYPSNVTEIILGYGYPCENHLTPPTIDGWKLSMQRIPHGKNNATQQTKGVVYFQHGLTDCSVGICLNPPFQSLAFMLADYGYDVWLGNNRGNGYSTINLNYNSKEKEYWDFSWDEMAIIDFPAMIDYVKSVTKSEKITYIGHSEGTIQAFAGLIYNNSIADSLNLYIALAPVAYVQYVESDIIQALADLHAEEIFVLLGDKAFSLPGAIQKLLPGICTITPWLCEFTVNLLCGPTTYFNSTRSPYYSNYEPNPTSVKNMVHWSQNVRDAAFQRYDYGSKDANEQHYNQPTPPQYEIQYFPSSLPLALFTGGEDYLADPKDVAHLISLLPMPPFVHTEPTYAHLDPLLGTNAYTEIYPMILQMIEKYQS
jgi:pimeloyl-ACP methyl ester carboxylesterase